MKRVCHIAISLLDVFVVPLIPFAIFLLSDSDSDAHAIVLMLPIMLLFVRMYQKSESLKRLEAIGDSELRTQARRWYIMETTSLVPLFTLEYICLMWIEFGKLRFVQLAIVAYVFYVCLAAPARMLLIRSRN